MNRILVPLILLILVIGAGGYYFLYHQAKNAPIVLPQGGVCEPDSMVCEDGTVLKRQLPNCDFPPCPSNSSTSSGIFNYSPLPVSNGEDITISGTIICLPHKNTTGPQTLECAFGLKAEDGNNYGLTDPDYKYLMGAGTGTKVKISGKLTKKQDTKYNSAGTITIENLIKVN